MDDITIEKVRDFLTTKYAESMRSTGLDPAAVPDNFDFLLSGVVDSFGILEMVSSIEQQFGIELDLANLDAEQMTIVGSLARYVADMAK
jgi:acyl carrier protein